MAENCFYEFTVTTHLFDQGTMDLKAFSDRIKALRGRGWELVKPLVPLSSQQGACGFMVVWRKEKYISKKAASGD